MKKILFTIPFLFLFCVSFSCQQGERVLVESKADVEADIQAIKDIFAVYNAGINASDIDGVMSTYADDPVVIRPNEPAEIGKEAVPALANYYELCEQKGVIL